MGLNLGLLAEPLDLCALVDCNNTTANVSVIFSMKESALTYSPHPQKCPGFLVKAFVQTFILTNLIWSLSTKHHVNCVRGIKYSMLKNSCYLSVPGQFNHTETATFVIQQDVKDVAERATDFMIPFCTTKMWLRCRHLNKQQSIRLISVQEL